MYLDHYEKYLSKNFLLDIEEQADSGIILRGRLIRKDDETNIITISKAIPRFVPPSNYADNFGLQWNEYRSTQLDSISGRPITKERLWKCTGWEPHNLKGKKILEIGSGAGRFTELLVATGAEVVSCDFSSAVDANFKNNGENKNLFLFQGDLFDLPLEKNSFDYILCYGVLQHTPEPVDAFRSVVQFCKSNGSVSVDFYQNFFIPTAWTTPKYLWRPLTTRLPPELLLKIVKAYVPWYLPFDSLLRRAGRVGTVVLGCIPVPCWNHVNLGLSDQQRVEWAVMDTFDALGAQFDRPFLKSEVERLASEVQSTKSDVFYGSQGIVCNLVM